MTYSIKLLILVWHSNKRVVLDYPIYIAWLISSLLCLSLYHTRMLIQRLQNWWIENPRHLTIQTLPMVSYWIVVTRMISVWIFQSIIIFEVIGLPQSINQKKSL